MPGGELVSIVMILNLDQRQVVSLAVGDREVVAVRRLGRQGSRLLRGC